MKRTIALVGSLVLLVCAIGAATYLTDRTDQIRRERAQATHRAAVAGSEEISRKIKTYWDRKNGPSNSVPT